MPPTSTPAIILHTFPYGETSKIARLLTRDHGVQSVMAKGALRPKGKFGARLQVLSTGNAQIYCKANRDKATLEDCIALVRGAGSVALLGPLGAPSDDFTRHGYCHAAAGIDEHPWGQYMPPEDLVVWLQTRFVDVSSTDRADVLALVGGLRDSRVREDTDDSYSQKVTTSAGVIGMAETKVKNPVQLAAWRTFPEVEQPTAPFVLRFRSGAEGERPTGALFQADGGQWRLDAMASIRRWLRGSLPEELVVLG